MKKDIYFSLERLFDLLQIHVSSRKLSCGWQSQELSRQWELVMMKQKVTDGMGVLPCHHQELVDLRVFELIVGVPHLGLQLLLDPVV